MNERGAMIHWTSEKSFSIGRTRFRLHGREERPHTSTFDEFLVFKVPWMIRRYGELVDALQPKRIVELGIHRGGSCVMLQELSDAEKLVAIELREKRVAALDEYIAAAGLEERVRPYYGTDQADAPTLKRILAEEFGGAPIDFVIDDASHFLEETRISFNAIFPSMRAGGIYVIEDWSWAHRQIGAPDQAPGMYPRKEPLTKLIFELILACGSTRQLIDKLEVNHNSAYIWRGDAPASGDDFDIAACSLARGRNLIA